MLAKETTMKITFLGAAQTVTGSKYLITTEKLKILVDCGLFQGLKNLRLRNWQPFPISPRTIDAILLTHAHIDHSGYIPLLVKNGFTGKIYCSPATKDLCAILLPDSGFLQEEEARFANKHGLTKHKPALPLYTRADAEKSLQQFHPVEFSTPLKLDEQFSAQFFKGGHILGASLIQLQHHDTRLLFSGDIGRLKDVFMKSPTLFTTTDFLVLESTYGNRLHEAANPLDELAVIINRTFKRGGTLVIPAFAVGRVQAILYLIYQLKFANRIPDLPIYLDSPMAVSATKLLCKYADEHNISNKICNEVGSLASYVNTPEESKDLDTHTTPMIIISASGMLEGGRVIHHLKTFATDPRNTILLTGYQAAGTRGEALINGKKMLKIHGEMISINAEIIELSNMSAHADYNEILNWLSHFKQAPHKVFLTHGEYESALSLKNKIEEKFNWKCVIPEYLQQENLK